MDKPLEDQGPIFIGKVIPTPEDKALASEAVLAHHQRSDDVLNRSEALEQEARFMAIQPYDSIEMASRSVAQGEAALPITRGLLKEELLVLIKFWENEARSERFFQWRYQQFSTMGMRLGSMRDDRIEQISELIGMEAVRGAIDDAFDEFDRDQRGSEGAAQWRCYLAEANPDMFGPASPEDLAVLERERESAYDAPKADADESESAYDDPF